MEERNVKGMEQRFLELVDSEFAFLHERGFRSAREREHVVRFENDSGVFVQVVRDPNDKYVGFDVGLTHRPKDVITAAELAKLTGSDRYGGAFAADYDELERAVRTVARHLRTNGERALSGDETIFDEAMELRREYTKQFTRHD